MAAPRRPAAPARAARRPTGAGARRGFTLIEVMVALLVMAVMAAIGWQGIDALARTRETTARASEHSLRLAAVMGQWEQDLAQLYDWPQTPALQFDGATLRLVRRSETGLQVVAWSLREGRLLRWAARPTQRLGELQQQWEAAQQLQGREPEQMRLLEGVSDWQLYFWRGSGWSNAQSSGDLGLQAEAGAPAPAATSPATPPAPPASTPAAGQNPTPAPAGGQSPAPAPGAGQNPAAPPSPPSANAARSRTLLPAGVQLQMTLPEGRLTRSVALAPQAAS